MARPRNKRAKKPPKPPMLHDVWRGLLAVVGAVFLGLGVYLWFSPAEHKEFAPQATSKAEVADVEDGSEVLSSLLVGLGALLLLLAADGRKLVSVKFAEQEIVWAAADAAEKEAEKKAKDANLSAEKTEEAKTFARQKAVVAAHSGLEFDTSVIAAEAVQIVK